jgi:hypothetical protein
MSSSSTMTLSTFDKHSKELISPAKHDSQRVPNAWAGQLPEPAGHLSCYLCAMKSLVIAASW